MARPRDRLRTGCPTGPSTRSPPGGTLAASAAIYAWGVESLYGPLPYLWVTVYVFYFFPLPLALVHLASIAAAFAAVIAVEDPDYTPVASWVATVGHPARRRRADRRGAHADAPASWPA